MAPRTADQRESGGHRPHSAVPHYLPGKSPFFGEYAYKYGVPLEAANGGVETTYPEYQARLKTLPKPTRPVPAK